MYVRVDTYTHTHKVGLEQPHRVGVLSPPFGGFE